MDMEIEKKIRAYIAKNLLFSKNGFGYSDEASFLEEGIVDSQGVMELVLYIEDEFQVAIADEEVTPDNFDSVQRIANYIRRKQGVAA